MLGTNMFFWDWGGAPTPPPPPLSDADIQTQQRGYGARGNDYRPMPEDYWHDRAKIIQVDKRDPSKVFEVPEMPGPPKVLNPAIAAQIDALTAHRSELAANLMSAPSVAELKTAAASIKQLDSQIAYLERKKYH